MTRQTLGKSAENLAKQLLLNKGYRFVTQNFRTPRGEIDLIFIDNRVTVFVEVKARTDPDQGLPEEAVNAAKLRTISRLAQHFLGQNPRYPQLGRIDVVAVELDGPQPHLRHLQNVTGC